MQRVLSKTPVFLKIARSGFKPTFSISQMRWRQSRIISRWSFNLQSQSLMTQIPSLFSTTQQTSTEEEEAHKEEGLIVPDQNQTISEKQVAEDLLKYISSDLKEIYTNQELKKTPLYKLLFQEGIHIDKLITTEPQDRLIKGSFPMDNRKNKYCVFFPNTTFQQIFQICESLGASEKTLITAQQGLGKTYALALYAYLKRKQSNSRVFYIHNCQDFVDLPFLRFLQQIAVAFAEELKIPELKQEFEISEKVLYDRKTTIEESVKEIFLFSKKLKSHLRKKDLKVYMIVDQVNVFAKEENKMDAEIANRILKRFSSAVGGIRNIYVASKTYENIISQTQERPEKELIPPIQQEDSLQAYIRFLAGDQTLEEKKIQSILNITGYVPLEVRNFFEFLGNNPLEEETLGFYKKNKIDSLKMTFNHFFKQDEEHLRHMALAFAGLINNGNYDSSMDRSNIDQRFLYVDVLKQKIYPLSPFVKQALKLCYLEQPKHIDNIVQEFQHNPAIMGYLTEMEVHKLASDWLHSSKFKVPGPSESSDEVTIANHGLQIDSSIAIENFEDKYNSDIFKILENKGYHTFHRNFPAFDGILVQDRKLVLIQIKRTSSNKVQEAATFIQKEIETFLNTVENSSNFDKIEADLRGVKKLSREEVIQLMLCKSIKKNKSLDIIFITSEGQLKNQYYKPIPSEDKALTIRFVELSIKDALEKALVSERTKDILSKALE